MNKKDLGGMTVNERLFVLGLLDDYDQAVKLKNRDEIIRILKKCELSDEQAIASTDQILDPSKHPTHFKRQSRKLLLSYLFVYPLYYVVAMGAGTLILWWMYDWSSEYAFIWFKISAVAMGIASYAIHWRIGLFAFTDSFRK